MWMNRRLSERAKHVNGEDFVDKPRIQDVQETKGDD